MDNIEQTALVSFPDLTSKCKWVGESWYIYLLLEGFELLVLRGEWHHGGLIEACGASPVTGNEPTNAQLSYLWQMLIFQFSLKTTHLYIFSFFLGNFLFWICILKKLGGFFFFRFPMANGPKCLRGPFEVQLIRVLLLIATLPPCVSAAFTPSMPPKEESISCVRKKIVSFKRVQLVPFSLLSWWRSPLKI